MEIALPEERDALAPLRATQWHGILSVEQFIERNRRLHAHHFGRQRITTYLLRDGSGRVLTSFDALSVRLLFKTAGSAVRETDGVLIASVITAPADRGKGYSSHLISSYFTAHPSTSGLLYSDIGPSFYARFGFHARPTRSVELAVSPPARSRTAFREMSPGDFARWLHRRRERAVLSSPAPEAAALAADPLWLDWQLERYRFFAELAGRELPRALFWEAEHAGESHALAAIPDYLTGRMEGFWLERKCASCLGGLHAAADSEGMLALRFWADGGTSWPGKVECPMVRVAGARGQVELVDPQFCDWW